MHDTIVRLADVWKTCNKIRAAVFRVGLNLWDWYRPLDPEGNSLISESKFVSVLAGPLRAVVGLSDAEIAQVADYFRAQDGRVLYHQLCQIIHGEDAGGRDKTMADCVLEACPPPREPQCRRLDQWQARRLCCLLATIAQRNLPLRPYFQDYELVAKNDGRITFAHFARILDYIGVIVSPEDFNLLVRRYIKDSYTLDYVAFLKEIEAVKNEGIQGLGPEYKHPKAVIDTTLPKQPRVAAGAGAADACHPTLQRPPLPRALLELMLRVQEFVLQRRIRVSEFFRDYDPLNSGRVTASQFVRALDAMGLGAVLRAGEARCAARQYADPDDRGLVCWRTFEDDCDQDEPVPTYYQLMLFSSPLSNVFPVFTTKELEKHPELTPGDTSAVAALGAAGARALSPAALDAAQAALMRVRAAVAARSVDLRPFFREHDEHNNGHVSRTQVRRVLARAGVLVAPEQLRALEQRYLDDCGFHYVALLDELDERPAESATIPRASAPARAARLAAADPHETDIVQILAKIKGKMVREGIRPYEFLQQFDKTRSRVIPRSDFYRGLAAAGLPLTPLEMDTLMEVFCAPGRWREVEYERFCTTVGEALTQGGLERAPMLAPLPHVPTRDSPLNYLNFEERSVVSGALAKLAKFPDQLSNILEVFKVRVNNNGRVQDADRERCGTLPRVSVERALARRGALALLSARERGLLYKCFGYRRGCEDEILEECTVCVDWDKHHQRYTKARELYTAHKEEPQNNSQVFYSADLEKVIMLPRDVEQVHIWLDNCSSQNKNWLLYSMLIQMINSEAIATEKITLYYFEPGHTFMSSDQVHHQVELAMKKKGKIYDFSDFEECVSSINKSKVIVQSMLPENFLNIPNYVSQRRIQTSNPRAYLKNMVEVDYRALCNALDILHATSSAQPC
ncbi:unnamed protein product, partial [Brenthis ino]